MEAVATPPAVPRKQEGGFIAKLGAWLQLAQVIGILVTVVIIMQSLHAMKVEGSDDPLRFGVALGGAMVFALAGVALSLFGVILVTIAVTALRYRARWMYCFLGCYGLLSLGMQMGVAFAGFHLTAAYHSPFGLFFIIFAMVKRREFLRAGVRDALPPCARLPE